MTNDLDGSKQRGQEPSPPRTNWIEDVRDMPHAVYAQAMVVVVKEYNDSASKGRVPIFGRWQESRDEAQDVAEEDEDPNMATEVEAAEVEAAEVEAEDNADASNAKRAFSLIAATLSASLLRISS